MTSFHFIYTRMLHVTSKYKNFKLSKCLISSLFANFYTYKLLNEGIWIMTKLMICSRICHCTIMFNQSINVVFFRQFFPGCCCWWPKVSNLTFSFFIFLRFLLRIWCIYDTITVIRVAKGAWPRPFCAQKGLLKNLRGCDKKRVVRGREGAMRGRKGTTKPLKGP